MEVPKYVWFAGGALVLGDGALLVDAMTSSKPKRIALIGDSFAVGLTGPLAALAKTAGVPFQAQGVVSTTPLQWSQHASACGPCGDWVSDFRPSVTLVSLGINDLGYSPKPPVAPYQAIARKFPNVWWLMPPLMPNDKLAGVQKHDCFAWRARHTGGDRFLVRGRRDPPDRLLAARGIHLEDTRRVGAVVIRYYPLTGVAKTIVGGYGNRTSNGVTKLHDAVDLGAPTGTPVVAVDDGLVVHGTDPTGGNIAILHVGTTAYYHAHLHERSPARTT